jgi:hypothetical protein
MSKIYKVISKNCRIQTPCKVKNRAVNPTRSHSMHTSWMITLHSIQSDSPWCTHIGTQPFIIDQWYCVMSLSTDTPRLRLWRVVEACKSVVYLKTTATCWWWTCLLTSVVWKMQNIKLKRVSQNSAYIFRVYAVYKVAHHWCIYKETPWVNKYRCQ